MTKVTSRSKVTKKGQITIPSGLRKKYSIRAGSSVVFEPSKDTLIIRPVKDMVSSAGSLSKYAKSKDVLKDLLDERKNHDYW
ncbi:MAG: AbrB/MazE/SpoVT family DNA-binding domain-containing protein [Nitrososphaerales archaeon]